MAHDFETQPELSNSQMQFYYWQSPFRQITSSFNAKCVKVTDGDSIRVTWTGRDFDFPIRLAGINAPELNNNGRESKEWLTDILEDTDIYVRIDPNNRTGKFGRIIGININNLSLSTGHSKVFE